MIDAEPDFRPKLPQVVDQLEVLSVICDEKCLGSGGQGVVFKGKFRGNDVAIKRIIKEDLSHSREANALNQLNHENVLKLLRSHDQGNFRYLPFFQFKNAILEKKCFVSGISFWNSVLDHWTITALGSIPDPSPAI